MDKIKEFENKYNCFLTANGVVYKKYEVYQDSEIEDFQVELCSKFINAFCIKTQKYSNTRTSYGYKHDVERHFNSYISNGAFIKAALLENIETRPLRLRFINCVFKLKLSKDYDKNKNLKFSTF